MAWKCALRVPTMQFEVIMVTRRISMCLCRHKWHLKFIGYANAANPRSLSLEWLCKQFLL